MNVFGNKCTFAIEFKLTSNPFEEKGLVGLSWGKLRLWVNGVSVCQYIKNNKKVDYEWNLVYIVDWFLKNLEEILEYEDFPLPVTGTNSLELIQKSNEFESDDDDEFDKWFDTKQDWEFKHSWFASRGGSLLAYIFFRRVNEKIEITWDNTDLYEEIIFINSKGVHYVNLTVFQNIVLEFVEFFLQAIRDLMPIIDSEYKSLYQSLKSIQVRLNDN